MREATIADIQMELWMRERERSEIRWQTRNGGKIPINIMSDHHLKNILNMAERNSLLGDIACEFQSYLADLD
jgi:hypothetical protein